MDKSKKGIAVLATCHNRKSKTLRFLTSLYNVLLPLDFYFEVFLVDDGSTDGTWDAVQSKFPKVNLIHGNGNLFWNQGMRLAWKTAASHKKFDFYLWLNDDTFLYKNALMELLSCDYEIKNKYKISGISVGCCESFHGSMEFSYGGRSKNGPISPNGKLQSCEYINGNVVLIPFDVYKILGNLSNDYTHSMGDIDYGLRAIKMGFTCNITKQYIAECENDKGVSTWANPRKPLMERWQIAHSPKGINVKEHLTFRRKFWGYNWIIYAIKIYAKILFPKIYLKLTLK